MDFIYETNCSLSYEFYKCQPLQVDPDITGIGVITNFIATAYITWTLFLFNYVFAHDPSTPPGRSADGGDSDENRSSWQPNPIDVLTIAWIRRVAGIQMRPQWAQIFDECILSMCDVQIITGYALLSCGFILAFSPFEPLSSYHWFLIVCLSWFSAITHLAGLSILRKYFEERPYVKAARIVLMFILLVILIIALVPTGFFNWRGGDSAAAPQSPAICFFDMSIASSLWASTKAASGYPQSLTDTPAMQQMILAVVMLVLGFTSRCIKLFQPLTRTLHRGIRAPAHVWFELVVDKLAKRLLRRPGKGDTLALVAKHGSFWDRFWIYTVFTPLFGLFLTGRLFADLVGSMLAEVLWVFIALLWGTFKFILIDIDSLEHLNMYKCHDYLQYGDDKRWTFGQMMAVALLAAPIFSLTWKFGELALQRKDDSVEQDRQPLSTNIEPVMNETSEAHPVSETPRRDQGAVATQSVLLDPNRDYYDTAPWIWAAIVTSYYPLLAIAGFTLFLAYFYEGSSTIFNVWIGNSQILPYLLLEFPAACTANMTAGLNLNQWYDHEIRWKRNLIFYSSFVVQFFHVSTVIPPLFFGFLPYPFITLPLLHYSLYILYCGLALLWEGKASRRISPNREVDAE